MERLDCVIQPYAWGSRTAIAELQGRTCPTATPEAELWLGAHPGAPSRIGDRSLLEHIRSAPERVLGTPVVERFGPGLPFLLKVLAAETPLSLQAHPSLEQAREGFAREDAQGVPRGAPHRNYKDATHKPELICALTPFDALCGFRSVEGTLVLFDLLASPQLEQLIEPLRASPDARGLARTFETLMTLPDSRRAATVDAAVQACRTLSAKVGGAFQEEARWAVRLAELYPGDPGVVGALLLNLLRLQPGEAIFLPAGNLHAYLNGVGVEIMANSDNVLRGGCTPKHVDVPELLRVLDFRPGPVTPLRASRAEDGEEVFEAPAPEFRLSRVVLKPGSRVSPSRRGPEILLCTEGEARVSLGGDGLALPRGCSAFVAAEEGAYSLEGEGVVFRATVGAL
jgi:mannose-6-phosphate isomerase